MITAIHRIGDDACGGIALYYDEIGAPYNCIMAERVTMPNGEKPTPNSIMVCGSCGIQISPTALDFLPGEFEEITECQAKSKQSRKTPKKLKSLLDGIVKSLLHLLTKVSGAKERTK